MAEIAPARWAAYHALRAVLSGRSDLPAALAAGRVRLADERDRSLAAEIAAGTIRWLASLDAVIVSFSGRPLGRLDPEILDILRLSAYQLLHLDRIPVPAVVHDAVELARAIRKQSASGLVNAVLRRIDRERGHLPLPARPSAGAPPSASTALDYLATTLSHPRWLVERWMSRFGFEAVEAWARFDNRPAPLTLRANTLRTTAAALADLLARHGVDTRPAPMAPDGLIVTRGNPLHTAVAERGLFLVQDEASQLVAVAAAARPGERIFDACAAPGGKTVAMAGDALGRGLLVASDLRPRRVRLLRDTLAACGAENVRIVRADAAAPLPFGPVFDAVLVDAPCSGLGTIRRDPEIRWRRTPDDLVRMAETQDRVLHCVSATVRPGGRLIYATCSSEPEENEDRVRSFLATHDAFAIASLAETAEPGRLPPEVVTPEGFLRTWPFAHGLEAFFAAVLRRAA